jgi:hypothetical protein
MHIYTATDDPGATQTGDGPGTSATPAPAGRPRTRRTVAVLVLTIVGLAGAAGTAAASVAPAAGPGSQAVVTRPIEGDDRGAESDDEPCGKKVTTEGGQEALVCPDWSPNGSIPVFRDPDAGSERIGSINAAGEDFYFCQTKGERHELGEFVNEWWALTDADGDAGIGWVPETYFKGGGPNVKDGVLQDCPRTRS